MYAGSKYVREIHVDVFLLENVCLHAGVSVLRDMLETSGPAETNNNQPAAAANQPPNQRPRLTLYAFLLCFLVVNPIWLVNHYWTGAGGDYGATRGTGRTLLEVQGAFVRGFD